MNIIKNIEAEKKSSLTYIPDNKPDIEQNNRIEIIFIKIKNNCIKLKLSLFNALVISIEINNCTIPIITENINKASSNCPFDIGAFKYLSKYPL